MSRSKTFVGLTKEAKEFISSFKEGKVRKYADGLGDEKFPLRNWKTSDGAIYEVVQEEPLSSGPVIFTCLSLPANKERYYTFMWEQDEKLKNEWDEQSGKFNF